MRARFEFPSGVPLRRGMSYLIFANWLVSGDTAPCWLMTPDVYPGGAGKQIFPPNGIVTGPWSDVFYSPSPSVDWAIRVYFSRDSRHRK
jgi:hypothetical protein